MIEQPLLPASSVRSLQREALVLAFSWGLGPIQAKRFQTCLRQSEVEYLAWVEASVVTIRGGAPRVWLLSEAATASTARGESAYTVLIRQCRSRCIADFCTFVATKGPIRQGDAQALHQRWLSGQHNE